MRFFESHFQDPFKLTRPRKPLQFILICILLWENEGPIFSSAAPNEVTEEMPLNYVLDAIDGEVLGSDVDYKLTGENADKFEVRVLGME